MWAKNRRKNRQHRKKVGIKSLWAVFEKKGVMSELPFFQIFQQAAFLCRTQIMIDTILNYCLFFWGPLYGFIKPLHKTPDQVYRTGDGGGGEIADHFGDKKAPITQTYIEPIFFACFHPKTMCITHR
ncbi:MAG: hypothetical protein PHU14_15390 [Methylovulum sp.]|nr:hypothetical protein [Methylovulum sp.]